MIKQNALPLVWPQRYDIGNYLVSECNEQAFRAITLPKNWQTPVLVLMAETAGGKSHLATIFQSKHDAMWISRSEDLETALTNDVKMAVIDDADVLLKDNALAQEKLFHLVNAMTSGRGHLLLTAKSPEANWIRLPDLLSRLQIATHITLEQPSEEMIKAAYQRLFTDRSLLVDDKVLDYLAVRTERSFAGIKHIVDELDVISLERSRKITIPLIQNLNLL